MSYNQPAPSDGPAAPPSSPPAAAEGERWLIGDVAEHFGVTPVHAARLVTRHGLTVQYVGRHVTIATYDPAEVRELASRRAVQAAIAAGRAAARRAEERLRGKWTPARRFFATCDQAESAALNAIDSAE